MRRLVVCCDGTWNNPDQEDNGIPAPTNVFKLYNAVADHGPDGTEQLKYYHPGVGGEGGVVDSILKRQGSGLLLTFVSEKEPRADPL